MRSLVVALLPLVLAAVAALAWAILLLIWAWPGREACREGGRQEDLAGRGLALLLVVLLVLLPLKMVALLP